MTPEITSPTPANGAPEPIYEGPTWEDDETRATAILRALFTILATGFLAYAQWRAPENWIGGIGENWGRWVWTSAVCNFLIPVLIVWMFFGQSLLHMSWLKKQKHNAWSYGVGWFQVPHNVSEAEAEKLVGKWGRVSYWKWWHPAFRNVAQLNRKKWKRHFTIALVCWLLFLPFLIYFSRQPEMRALYADYLPPVQNARDWLFLISTLVVYMFCWEWFFRGFALFGTAQGLGVIPAIALQAAIFGLSHKGKPEIEMWSAFAGGLVLGTLAWREKSFFPAFLIHALIHVSWAILVLI